MKKNKEPEDNIYSESVEVFRQSREIIDNKLSYKTDDSKQLELFSTSLSSRPGKGEIVIKGLDLTPAEDRLIYTLSLLLSKNSEKYDQNSPNYYMGNFEKGIIASNDHMIETARISITPHQLYSAYTGRTDYSSDHIRFILDTLDEMTSKNFQVTMTLPSKKNSNDRVKKFDKFRTKMPLFNTVIINQGINQSESQEIEFSKGIIEGKNAKFLFKFSPLFTNNIRERYVEFPEDIHLRIARASGKRGRISQCTNLMRDFIFREKQQGRHSIVRDEATLLKFLKLEKMRNEGRKKKVRETLDKSFQIFLTMNLLTKVDKKKGKNGQLQYAIEINPEFS